MLSIEVAPLQPLWPVFVQAKARRNLGVHNRWICNSTYVRKVKEAELTPEFKEGESTFPPAKSDPYFRKVRDAIAELSSLMAIAVLEKHDASLRRPHPIRPAPRGENL